MNNLNSDFFKKLDLCPVCESKNIKLFSQISWDVNEKILTKLGVNYFYPKWSICNNCSHVFLNPRFSDKFEKKLYGNDSIYRNISHRGQSTFDYMMTIDNTIDGSAKYHKTHFLLLKKILKIIGKSKNIKFLDFGAGWGSCSTAAKAHNIKYNGLELDRWCLEQAQILNRNVKSSYDDFENLDLIYSSQVFEHINNPKKVLETFVNKMKHGSYIFTNVPTYEFNSYRNWGIGGLNALNWFHCQSYSRESLSHLFQQYGFKTVKSWLGTGDINILVQKTGDVNDTLKINNNSIKRREIGLKFHKLILVKLHYLLMLPKNFIKYLIR